MEYVALKEVCNIIMGQSPDSSSYNDNQDGIPFFQGNADFGERYPVTRVWCNAPTKIAQAEDILLSVRAPIGAMNYAKEECCIGRGLAALTPDKSKVSLEFIYWFLKWKKDDLNRKGTGSTFKAISRKVLEEIMVPKVELDIQNKYAEILEKTYSVIQMRKQELQHLDDLIKARFVEMFGDPVINPREWDIKAVIDVCDCMVPGRDKPKSFSGDIPWITIDDLIINGVTCESKARLGLTEEEIAEVKRKTVPTNSVLMSCVGNLGICSIAGSNLVINQQLHSFQCSEKINNYFLMHQLGWKKDYMNKHASSTTVLYMNKAVCNSIPIILPPIELQNQFADFVQQVNKSKFVHTTITPKGGIYNEHKFFISLRKKRIRFICQRMY